MKKNKGFTLIELLAVIVILAIIALIATPIILGVIEDARKSSAESSALGYVDAVEKQIALDMLASEADSAIITDYVPGQDINNVPISGLKVNGTTPTAGTIKTTTDGVVTTGTCLQIKLGGTEYKVEYDGSKAKATAGETCPTTTPSED